MSNAKLAIAEKCTTATIPAATLKKFEGAELSALVSFLAETQFSAMPHDEFVKPSMLRLDASSARTGIGAQSTKESIIQSLFWHVAKFAYGSKSETLQQGLPRIAQYMLVASIAGIKQGSGVTKGKLIDCVIIGINAALALPKAQKQVKETKVIEQPKVQEESDLYADSVWNYDQAKTTVTQAMLDETKSELEFLKLSDDVAQAKAAHAAMLENGRKEVMRRLTAEGESRRAKAHALAALANEIGIKLTKVQLSALDAFESVESVESVESIAA